MSDDAPTAEEIAAIKAAALRAMHKLEAPETAIYRHLRLRANNELGKGMSLFAEVS